jgi:hypothetical protein
VRETRYRLLIGVINIFEEANALVDDILQGVARLRTPGCIILEEAPCFSQCREDFYVSIKHIRKITQSCNGGFDDEVDGKLSHRKSPNLDVVCPTEWHLKDRRDPVQVWDNFGRISIPQTWHLSRRKSTEWNASLNLGACFLKQLRKSNNNNISDEAEDTA